MEKYDFRLRHTSTELQESGGVSHLMQIRLDDGGQVVDTHCTYIIEEIRTPTVIHTAGMYTL